MTPTENRITLQLLEGECRGCGACCTKVGCPPFSPALVSAVLQEHEGDAGELFEDLWPDDLATLRRLRDSDEGLLRGLSEEYTENRFGQTCTWLDPVTRQCGHYEHRPETCRTFQVGGDWCVSYRLQAGLPVPPLLEERYRRTRETVMALNDVWPEMMNDRVLVRMDKPKDKSAGGILLPESAQKSAQPVSRGEVLAVGPGKHYDFAVGRRPTVVRVGDRVIFGKYAGSEIELDGVTFRILSEDEIYGRGEFQPAGREAGT